MDFHQISSDKSYSKILQTENPQQCYDDEQTNQNGEHQVDVDIVDNQREEGGLCFQLRDENDSVKTLDSILLGRSTMMKVSILTKVLPVTVRRKTKK